MDSKNIIAAISLSAAVIILFQLFFAPTPQERKQIQAEKNKTNQNATNDAPSLDQNNETVKISREEAMKEGKRILFENENIKGSISLTGSKIDDLEFKKFKAKLNGEENVTLLNPSKVRGLRCRKACRMLCTYLICVQTLSHLGRSRPVITHC